MARCIAPKVLQGKENRPVPAKPRAVRLAAGTRPERQSSLSICSPTKGRSPFCSQREGAERRKGAIVLSVLLRGSTCRPCEGQLALRRSTAVFSRWDPSTSPGRHGYCPMALFRRRDGSFHPRLLSEPEGLLHRLPDSRFARPSTQAPHPHSHPFACRTSLSEWGYVRHTHATRQCP